MVINKKESHILKKKNSFVQLVTLFLFTCRKFTVKNWCFFFKNTVHTINVLNEYSKVANTGMS